MERNRSITIEPYIDQGGQLGEKIELNEPVALGFMKRADLRRNVLVEKGSVLPERGVVEMSDELAFKGIEKANNVFVKTETLQASDIRFEPNAYRIFVHDRIIDERIRGRLSSVDNRGYYDEEFVLQFNKETTKALRRIITKEKLEILDKGSHVAAVYAILVEIGAVGLIIGSRNVYEGISMIRKLDEVNSAAGSVLAGGGAILISAGGLWTLMSFGQWGEESRKAELGETPPLKSKWEAILPRFPALSFLNGQFYLLTNGSKLIKKI